MKELRLKALSLEKEAKKAREEKDFEKASELHFKAAEIYKQIEDGRNWKWNLANYLSIKGTSYSLLNNFDKAREFYKKGIELFLELGLKKPAFSCESYILRTYYIENKKKGIYISKQYNDYIKQFLDKYKDFSSDKAYIWAKVNYLKAKAKNFEEEKRFVEAAECYKKSAKFVSNIDENESQDEYISHYKCLAIANKYNMDNFKKYINKAIELADKRGDEKQKFYFLGLKYDHLAKLIYDMEERIKYLKQAKDSYYKAGDEVSGELIKFILFFNLSQNELRKGNYKKAINLLEKTISMGDKVCFPNIVPSIDVLSNKRFRYEGYLYISQGKFNKSAKSWSLWLEKNKEIEKTKIYQVLRVLKYNSSLLGKRSFSMDDLYELENIIEFVRLNRLGIAIYEICSLTYSFISLCIHNIKNKDTLNKIKLNIINKITPKEIADELKYRFEIQRAIEEHDWLLRLPSIFLEKFDSCLYFLNNVLDEYRHTAIREFYNLLEKFIEVIVEFNAKILLGERWELELKEVVNTKKPFKAFSFGDLIKLLNFLKDKEVEFCRNIPKKIFKLLDKHIPIRNNLSHDLIKELQKFDISEDTSKIMFSLLYSFPTCIKVIDTRKKPWYVIDILWNQLPKRVTLYSEHEIEKGNYYIEPISEVRDNQLQPKLIIPASTLNLKK